jgi:hypothetical protein
MKKIFLLLVMLLLMSISGRTIYSQDPFITIGKLKLRYDLDSNMLKIGFSNSLVSSSLRIGKELETQLFKFRTTDFAWSNSEGLYLAQPLSHDSVWSKIFAVTRDTTFDETDMRRTLSLKKFFWSNTNNDIWGDWMLHYYSRNALGVTSTDSCRLIGDAKTLSNEFYPDEYFGVDSWTTVDTLKLNVRGLYLITYEGNLIFPYTEVDLIEDKRDSVSFRLVAAEGTGDEQIPAGSKFTVWKEFKASIKYTPESNVFSRTFTYNYNNAPPFTGEIEFYLQIRADLNTELINAASTKTTITYSLIR